MSKKVHFQCKFCHSSLSAFKGASVSCQGCGALQSPPDCPQEESTVRRDAAAPPSATQAARESAGDVAAPDREEAHMASSPSCLSAVGVLRAFGWVNLVAGIIAGVWIGKAMGTREVAREGYLSVTETALDPLGVALGFACILEGCFACALILVVCSMAENLSEIRRHMDKAS